MSILLNIPIQHHHQYYWRVVWSKTVTGWILYELYEKTALLKKFWRALPETVTKIDAGIVRKDDKFYMFSGPRFWILKNNLQLANRVPEIGLPLSELGLPSDLKKIDTIFRWGYNDQLYIMAGVRYWKLDETSGHFGHISPNNYPRKIKDVWQSVPTPVTTAFTEPHKKTYFFVGKQYYLFDNLIMRVREGYPKPASLSMLGCKSGN